MPIQRRTQPPIVASTPIAFSGGHLELRRRASSYDGYALGVVETGNVLIWSSHRSQWYVVMAPALVVLKTPFDLSALHPPGTCTCHLVEMTRTAAPLLMEGLDQIFANRSCCEPTEFAIAPFEIVGCKDFQKRFVDSLDPSSVIEQSLLLGYLHTAMQRVAASPSDLTVRLMANGVQEPFLSIIDAVRKNPEADWRMSAVADKQGYSPYHFSRSFAKQTGLGFRELVGKCRTAKAIKLLCSTKDPVEVIADRCRFPSVASLKSAVKGQVGLSVSTLRTPPGL